MELKLFLLLVLALSSALPAQSALNDDVVLALVVGGSPTNLETEIVALGDKDGSVICNKPADFPQFIGFGEGFDLNGSPIICGGRVPGNYFSDACFIYFQHSNMWTEMTDLKLQVGRYVAASVVHDNTWYIAGGQTVNGYMTDHGEILEFGQDTIDGFKDGPVMAQTDFYHCMVDINKTHVMSTGGWNGMRQSYLMDFETGEWTQAGGDMIKSHYSHACGLINTPDRGPEVVVAGGPFTDYSEIFSLHTGEWRLGPKLPVHLMDTATVQQGNSFYIIGGRDPTDSYTETDKIFWFDPDALEFVEQYQKLDVPRFGHIVIPLKETNLCHERK